MHAFPRPSSDPDPVLSLLARPAVQIIALRTMSPCVERRFEDINYLWDCSGLEISATNMRYSGSWVFDEKVRSNGIPWELIVSRSKPLVSGHQFHDGQMLCASFRPLESMLVESLKKHIVQMIQQSSVDSFSGSKRNTHSALRPDRA